MISFRLNTKNYKSLFFLFFFLLRHFEKRIFHHIHASNSTTKALFILFVLLLIRSPRMVSYTLGDSIRVHRHLRPGESLFDVEDLLVLLFPYFHLGLAQDLLKRLFLWSLCQGNNTLVTLTCDYAGRGLEHLYVALHRTSDETVLDELLPVAFVKCLESSLWT